MSEKTVEELGAAVAELMMQAAARWLRRQGIRPSDQQCEAVCAELKQRAPGAVEEGLRDARQATEAGLTAWAASTFATSLELAGTRAAEAVCGAVEGS
jgi:hypothetical protein